MHLCARLASPRPARQSSETGSELAARWLALPAEQRSAIKTLSLSGLSATDRRAAGVAAQAVSAIAAVELPVGEWQDVIGRLLEFVGAEEVGLRVATLQCVGYICEAIVSDRAKH